MEHRRALFLPLSLLLFVVCTMACSGPTPTAAPPFFKFPDRIDLLAVAPDSTVWVTYYSWANGLSHSVDAEDGKP